MAVNLTATAIISGRSGGAVAAGQQQRDRARRGHQHEEVVVEARHRVEQEDRVEGHEHDRETRVAARAGGRTATRSSRTRG